MIILHGENQVESRRQLLLAKTGKVLVELIGASLDPNQLDSSIETNSLFGQAQTAVIESVFSQRVSNSKKKIVEYLEKNTSRDIIIWEPKDVSSQLKAFPPQIIQRFDFPKHIFAFLDHPNLASLQTVLSTTSPEIVFASLVTRAHKQVKTTWLEELLSLDYQLKTGQLPYGLSTALELWVAKL